MSDDLDRVRHREYPLRCIRCHLFEPHCQCARGPRVRVKQRPDQTAPMAPERLAMARFN